MFAQRFNPPVVACSITNLWIQLRRISDVVAMRASRHCLEVARGITVRNAQTIEVADDLRRIVEGECLVELKSVRGGRNGGGKHLAEVMEPN
jgi:hypothetical protein